MKRTSLELLILLRDQVKTQNRERFYGMCEEINELFYDKVIASYERDTLDDFLSRNIPEGCSIQMYWWKSGVKKPRLKWINKHIKTLKDAKKKRKQKRTAN